MRFCLKQKNVGRDVFCPLVLQNSYASTRKGVLHSFDLIKGRRRSIIFISILSKNQAKRAYLSLPSNIYEQLTKKAMWVSQERRLLQRGVNLHIFNNKNLLWVKKRNSVFGIKHDNSFKIRWLLDEGLDRMEEDRMTKKIFTQELEGMRRRGRPRKRWEEEIERILQVWEWEDGESWW